MADPALAAVVAFYNMRREAPRTLHTLSPGYQRNVAAGDYEVIAIDNGSTEPLDPALARGSGGALRLVTLRSADPSPAAALNHGARLTRAPRLAFVYDGARMLSPGFVAGCLRAFRDHADPFVFTVAMHLGPGLQNESMLQGYDQRAEDALLATVDWRANGYTLFQASTLAASSRSGLLVAPNESGAVALTRQAFERLGGYDERFRAPGGGLANVDFFDRAMRDPALEPVLLVGEATFHQFHGGVATNVAPQRHPYQEFMAEYLAIRGAPLERRRRPVHLLGAIPPEASRLPTGSIVDT